MGRVRTTLSIDEELLRALRVRAARDGCADSDVMERALRRELGFDLLDRLWDRNDMAEDEARDLVQKAVRETRRARR